MDKINDFDNNQLLALSEFIDCDNFLFLLHSINCDYSAEKIDILGKAIEMNIDISDVLNPRISSEYLIVLIDSKMKGIDIKGLDNELVDLSLLKQLIKIKSNEPNQDLSFIKNLNLSDCKKLVQDYDEAIKSGIDCDFKKYWDKVNLTKRKILMEIEYVVNSNKLK